MKDVALMYVFFAVCFNVGLTIPRTASNTCREANNGACGRGQYVVFSERLGQKCVKCPKSTFMDLSSHECGSCKEHTQPNPKEVIIMHGDSTVDNVIICMEGFFSAKSLHSGVRGECERCTACGDGMWAAIECSADEDTFCCPYGLFADPGRATCVLPDPRLLYQKQASRKERSSGNSETNSSGTNEDNTANNARTGENSQSQSLEGDSESASDNGHSSADAESGSEHEKVYFPVWARILCAGVAIGVFLFYLGVGIPCNACGSRDKLRALRMWIFHRHDPVPTEEEQKEKPGETRISTSDPV